MKGCSSATIPGSGGGHHGSALGECGSLITTGGVSAGDKGYLPRGSPSSGAERVFWKVNLQPGTPAMYSPVAGTAHPSSRAPLRRAATFELRLVAPFWQPSPGNPASPCAPRTARGGGLLPQGQPRTALSPGFLSGGPHLLTGKMPQACSPPWWDATAWWISPLALPRCRRAVTVLLICSMRFPICFDLEVSKEPKFNHFDAEGNAGVWWDVSATISTPAVWLWPRG